MSTFPLHADFNQYDGTPPTNTGVKKYVDIRANEQVLGDNGVIFDDGRFEVIDGVLNVDLPSTDCNPYVFGYTISRDWGRQRTWNVPAQPPNTTTELATWTATTPLPIPTPDIYVRTVNGQSGDVTVSAGSSLTVQDENGNVSTGVSQIDFQGAGVTASAGTGEVVVTIPGGSSVEVAGTALGSVGKTYGEELWTLANFKTGGGLNSTTLSPTLTADGSNKTLHTMPYIGNVVNQDRAYRYSLLVKDLPIDGWAGITIQPSHSDGGLPAGALQQVLITNNGVSGGGSNINVPVEFDFDSAGWGDGGIYLDVALQVLNNSTVGAVSITDVSLKSVDTPHRPLIYGRGNDSNIPSLWVPLQCPDGTWRMARTDFGADGALTAALVGVTGFNTDQPWRDNTADPTFTAATGSIAASIRKTEELLAGGEVSAVLRIQNNDQIINVKKADTSYELRGNVHGGETLRAGAANQKWQADRHGDGTWADWDGTGKYQRNARRFRLIYNTQMQRSDAASPFANVDHTATFYPDGTMRMDRTMTFLSDQRVNVLFEWMMTNGDGSSTGINLVGRIGSGLTVLGDVNTSTLDKATSDRSDWAVYYHAGTGICIGQIYDREAVAARPNIRSVTNRLLRGSGIVKNYFNVWFNGDGLDSTNDAGNGEGYSSRLVTAGTVWSATHWTFTYVPQNATDYHAEIARRSLSLSQLKVSYPAT